MVRVGVPPRRDRRPRSPRPWSRAPSAATRIHRRRARPTKPSTQPCATSTSSPPSGVPVPGRRDRGAHSRGPLATNEVTLAIASLASVAVRDHDIVRSVVGPDEADTGLIVDSDGMLARPVFGQLLKSVAGSHPKIAQL